MSQGVSVKEVSREREEFRTVTSVGSAEFLSPIESISSGWVAIETEALPFPEAEPYQASVSHRHEKLIRCLDISGAIFVAVLTLPLMLVFALLVKITSVGPVLYKQYRVGVRGENFMLYKFRSMKCDAESECGPVWADKDDDRVTKVGKVMRKMRVDELPQLFNVLRGEMSLVGPRPERPFFVEQHATLQGIRLSVKPGITGLAQIKALYDLRPEHKLKYDFLYIKNRTLLLNAYILFKTIPVVLSKSGW